MCPFCAEIIPSPLTFCSHCGKDVQDLFFVVPDGTKYGIELMGEVMLHGMELERAREVASILNSVEEWQR